MLINIWRCRSLLRAFGFARAFGRCPRGSIGIIALATFSARNVINAFKKGYSGGEWSSGHFWRAIFNVGFATVSRETIDTNLDFGWVSEVFFVEVFWADV